jgi:hypothetical protein
MSTEYVPSTFCTPTTGSKIFLSICPLLLAFGTCTNILSLLVLTRKRMRKHSTYLYLAILSIIDMLALHLGLIRDYLAHGYCIYINTTWLCRLHSFLFYYTLDFSSWILVAVSIDRFLAITFVFSSYTRHLLLKLLAKPKLICCIIGTCLFFLNLHFFFYIEAFEFKTKPAAATSIYNNNNKNSTVKIDENYFSIGVSGEYLNCGVNEKRYPRYSKFFQNNWAYIDLSAYAILPFFIMSVCNIAIIKNAKFSLPSVTKSKLTTSLANISDVGRLEQQQQQYKKENKKKFVFCCLFKLSKTNKKELENNYVIPSQIIKAQTFFSPMISATHTNTQQSRNIKMMTLTIISVTCIFIILTLPVMLYIVIEKITTIDGDFFLDPNRKAVIWSVLNVLMYINHSINFVLYCLTGSKFRTELATLFVSTQKIVNAYTDHSPHSTSLKTFSSIRYSSIRIPPLPTANYVAVRTQNTLNGNTKV